MRRDDLIDHRLPATRWDTLGARKATLRHRVPVADTACIMGMLGYKVSQEPAGVAGGKFDHGTPSKVLGFLHESFSFHLLGGDQSGAAVRVTESL